MFFFPTSLNHSRCLRFLCSLYCSLSSPLSSSPLSPRCCAELYPPPPPPSPLSVTVTLLFSICRFIALPPPLPPTGSLSPSLLHRRLNSQILHRVFQPNSGPVPYHSVTFAGELLPSFSQKKNVNTPCRILVSPSSSSSLSPSLNVQCLIDTADG